jgi:ubiquinone/menaquinone biosynthesis C-methylase UbiE
MEFDENFKKIDAESLWWLMVVHEYDPIFYMRARIQGSECLQLQKAYAFETALDIGCGPGSCWPFLKSMNIIGLDIKIGKLLKKRAAKYGVELIKADAQHLPVREETVALVLCEEVLEHLNDPLLALHEISRVMKNDAKLLVDVPALLDKIRDPALAPFVILLERFAEKIRGQTEQKELKEEYGGELKTVETISRIIGKMPSKSVRLLAFRIVWIFWTARSALAEHVGTYGWAWKGMLERAGFTIEKVQGCAILYLPALLMKNLEPLNQIEDRIRSRYPFRELGQILCMRLRKN